MSDLSDATICARHVVGTVRSALLVSMVTVDSVRAVGSRSDKQKHR